MVESQKFERPRGTHDFLPRDMVCRNHVERIVRSCFETYGYHQIQTPTFELFDLLSARSGEEIRSQMFTFHSDAEEYALRPELTSSVCRLVTTREWMAESNRIVPPYKLYYIDKCYRYCRPQSGRTREFTQAGVELLGSNTAQSDAELIAVAMAVLKRLGIRSGRLKVGNIEVLKALLDAPDDGSDTHLRLIHDLSHVAHIHDKCASYKDQTVLSNDAVEFLRQETRTLYSLQEDISYRGDFEIQPSNQDDVSTEHLLKLPSVAEATYRAIWLSDNALKDVLSSDKIETLLSVLRLRGPLSDVRLKATKLLSGTKAANSLEHLFNVCEWLSATGITDFEVVLGLVRGLDFYTSIVFEIDSAYLGAQKQLCGGGRYDRLVEEFGGPSLPASGFAFGFDRLVKVFESEVINNDANESARMNHLLDVDLYIAADAAECRRRAADIAERLREPRDEQPGWRVVVDLCNKSIRDQIAEARKLGAIMIVDVTPESLANGKLTVGSLPEGRVSEDDRRLMEQLLNKSMKELSK